MRPPSGALEAATAVPAHARSKSKIETALRGASLPKQPIRAGDHGRTPPAAYLAAPRKAAKPNTGSAKVSSQKRSKAGGEPGNRTPGTDVRQRRPWGSGGTRSCFPELGGFGRNAIGGASEGGRNPGARPGMSPQRSPSLADTAWPRRCMSGPNPGGETPKGKGDQGILRRPACI